MKSLYSLRTGLLYVRDAIAGARDHDAGPVENRQIPTPFYDQNPEDKMSDSRWKWVDVSKGIAIVLVVLNHTGEGIINASLAPRTVAWNGFHDLCYTFMVPVFFLFSGLFAQRSSKSQSQRQKALLSNLVYPYLLFSCFQAAVMIVTKAGNKVPHWSDLPAILIDGWMQFWFLHCLILLMVIDLVFRALKTPAEVRLIFAVLLTCISIFEVNLPWTLSDVAGSIIYFEAGVFFGTLAFGVSEVRTLVFLALSAAVLLVTFQFNGAGYPTHLKVIGGLAGVLACCAFARLVCWRENVISHTLEYLGRYSLQIYVLHVVFAAGTRVVLKSRGLDLFWIQFPVGSAVGLLGPCVVAYADERFFHALFRFPSGRKSTA